MQKHCLGVIDGTFRPCARPIVGHEHIYSGHHKSHGIKFQVVAPNGLILDFFGPVPGCLVVGYILHQSQFLARMHLFCNSARRHYYIYGDPAYALARFIMLGLRGATPQQQAFSTAMCSARVVVE